MFFHTDSIAGCCRVWSETWVGHSVDEQFASLLLKLNGVFAFGLVLQKLQVSTGQHICNTKILHAVTRRAQDESASSEASSESASDASAGAGASDASAGSVSDEGSGSEEEIRWV